MLRHQNAGSAPAGRSVTHPYLLDPSIQWTFESGEPSVLHPFLITKSGMPRFLGCIDCHFFER